MYIYIHTLNSEIFMEENFHKLMPKVLYICKKTFMNAVLVASYTGCCSKVVLHTLGRNFWYTVVCIVSS